MEELVSHLRSEGFELNEVIPDGKIRRFKIDRADDKKSGFYVAFRNFGQKSGEEFYVVRYGSWRDGVENASTFSTLRGVLSSADKENLKAQMERAKKEAERVRVEGHEIAGLEVQKKWETLSLTGNSEYLNRKKIQDCPGLGIKFDNFSGDIYVPLRDESGKLWSLQRIERDGTKRFHPGARTSGCFHVVGGGTPKYIAEGLATAASIHLATNEAVVCAFSSSGLKAVAVGMRRICPDGEFFICGDDDATKEGNPGKLAAEAAGRAAACAVIYPSFGSGNGTDFNDLHATEGLDAVSEQLASVSLPETIEQMSAFDIVNAPFPDENEKTFKRKGTIANVAELLKRLNIRVRYNVISKEEETLIPNRSFSIDNQANASLAHILSWCERVSIPHGNLTNYLTAIADANPYNPVATWITSKPWDGESRLSDFFATITAKGDQGLKETLIFRWLISAVAACFEPNGVSAHGVLVLQGEQYLGKTMWFKRLVPEDLSLVKVGAILRPDDKDSLEQNLSYWLVELGELDATFKKSDIAQLKGFLTNSTDTFRTAYARRRSEYARRTVFFGSVNETDYLKDPTGNRRFWTVECEKIDYAHSIDMQQLWAEVYQFYLNGTSWFLTQDEMARLNTHNEEFEGLEPIEELILNSFSWNNRNPNVKMTASEVCRTLGIEKPNQKETRAAARILRRLKAQSATRKNKCPGFDMPAKIITAADPFLAIHNS